MIAPFGRGLSLVLALFVLIHASAALSPPPWPAPAAPMKASATSPPWRWIPASGRKSKACASAARRPCSPAKAMSKARKASRRHRDLQAVSEMAEDRLVLSFRDAAGHTGTLSLTRPATISVFEVDPRNRPDRGHGPTLYKEWKLSAPAAGSGVFAPGIAPAPDPDADLSGRRQFLHLLDRLYALDAGDAGPEGQLHPVRRPRDGEISVL